MNHLNKIGQAELKLLKEIYKDNLDYALKKLDENYPIQYLIGYVDFYNTKIKVNEHVLIPRYETEILVDKILNFLKNKDYKNLIDICTGSGAIAIALSKELKTKISACDISNEALEIARENAKENNVEIEFFQIDILKETIKEKYDCIISNPPYVTYEEYVSEETKYEPQIALYAENNGLEFYEKIIKDAVNILNSNGSIIFEIGAKQANDIKKIALSYFPDSKVTILKDYNNFDRFLFIET